MIKILTVIGARPQFIKAAPVSRAMARQPGIREVILHTGQHFDHNMSQVFFDQMQIPRPTYELNIHSMDHGAMTGSMLIDIEQAIKQEQPDWVMVYGDTNSTLAGALAAVKQGVKVAHVEAGLRSFNMGMPEEVNRILTDRVSSLLFCPTIAAIENLSREGFDHFPCRIELTGDVMYDACLQFSPLASPPNGPDLPQEFVLATIHRAENTGEPTRMNKILYALNKLSDTIPVVFPVHPRTQKLLDSGDFPVLSEQVRQIQPVGYLEMLHLLNKCRMVLTDSGGLQKEAYFFEKPCVTIREETEWTELVNAGYNKVCGTEPDAILAASAEFLQQAPVFVGNLYGKGNAAEKITAAFLEI
jgi:UDP-GlcNAc3NAcA epimerase